MQEKDKKSNGSVIRIHPWETKMLTFTMFIDWNRLVNQQFWNSCGYTCTRSKEKKEQGQVQESSKYFLKIRLCLVWYWYPCKLQQTWAGQNLKILWNSSREKKKFLKICWRPWELPANQHWPYYPPWLHGRCWLAGKSHGHR